jgi:mono/diheme cytochrome c family protein
MWVVGGTASGGAQYRGWFIPAGGAEETSPLRDKQGAAADGKALYVANCASCHGPDGKGSDAQAGHASDLTDDLRTSINPEGVLFYKVWNGHSIQLKTAVNDMPAFRDRLSRDQVWAVVEYLKVLREPSR